MPYSLPALFALARASTTVGDGSIIYMVGAYILILFLFLGKSIWSFDVTKYITDVGSS